MLLARDFVAHMASEVVKRLVEGGQIETKVAQAVTTRVRQCMLEELTVEDRLNEEVRQIIDERDTIRQQIVQILTAMLKAEEKIEQDVRKRITSQKKEILEGSEEWDVLHKKYYQDELRRLGIGAAPDDRHRP